PREVDASSHIAASDPHCPVHTRVLPSFPTRRSSDLKADLPGFGKLKALLKELVMMSATETHMTAIVKTITTENKGIDKLWDKMQAHHDYLYSTTEGEKKRKMQQELEVYELIREEIWRDVKSFIENHDQLPDMKADTDPYQLASDWFDIWKKEGGLKE